RTKPSAVAAVFQRRTGPVRRSFSDRSSPTKTNGYEARVVNGTGPGVDQFNDTMALRVRTLRTDSRTAFEDETASSTSSSSSSESSIGSVASLLMAVGQSGKARPKLPPPPPPPLGSTSVGKTLTSPASASPPLTNGTRTHTTASNNVYEDFCFGLMAGVRRSSSDRSSSTSTSSRTVVQVLASSSASSSPISSSAAIHRLEIRHDPEPEEEHYQKKTSIMITGDDCYSTVNVDGASDTPIYQSSVVVNDGSLLCSPANEIRQTASNTITISVSSPTSTLESRGSKSSRDSFGKGEELAVKNGEGKSEQATNGTVVSMGRGDEVMTVTTGTSIIPIGGSSVTGSNGRTLINLDFSEQSNTVPSSSDNGPHSQSVTTPASITPIAQVPSESNDSKDPPMVREDVDHDSQQQQQVVVKQCLVDLTPTPVVLRRSIKPSSEPSSTSLQAKVCRNSFIAKLLEDPSLSQLSEGLDYDLIAKLIENSLLRLKESRNGLDMSGTKDEDDVSKMIEQSLLKIQEERSKLGNTSTQSSAAVKLPEIQNGSKRSSVSSGNSYGSAAAYELMEFDQMGDLSDCYQSCSSDLTVDDDANSSRSKFYQMLVDATLSEIEINTTNDDDDHHYESIRLNGDPIYEEINDIPPPLPLTAPPID
uniref:Uncharacterized protein n=1 Tax=Anopheles maculatus TaxID=74869 RepID=A0A182SUG9_9DIPT